MDCETFLEIVEHEIRDSGDAPAKAVRATLETLGERIDRGLARRVAAQLPAELAPWIATLTPADSSDVDEFVSRVATREGVDLVVAVRHVRAVFGALARAIPADLWADIAAELPRSFTPLLPRGPYLEVVGADAFLREVADGAGLDLEDADRAADAVLETLSERIAGGEVDDLIERMPIEFHSALKRGRAAVRGQPKPMKLNKFIHTVADREGVAITEAALHTRAVFLALRELLDEEEFRDIAGQLPSDYVELLTG